MTLYWRTSTFVESAARRAGASIFVLKPTTTAPDAAARVRSDSVMSPTPSWMICSPTSSCGTFASAPLIASSEPCTSALSTILSSLALPSLTCANISSRVAGLSTPAPPARSSAFCAASAFAVFSSGTARNTSPARGTVGVRLQLGNVRDQEHDLEEILDALLRARGDRHERRVSAVLLDRDAMLRELRLHLVRVRVGLVDLVERDDDRDVRRLDV